MKRTKGQKKGRIEVILGISIIAAFLAIGMAGCSSSEQKQDAEKTTVAAEQQAAGTESSEETKATAEEESQTAESEETTKATETKETQETTKAEKKPATAATKKSDAAKKPAQTARTDKKSETPKKSTTEKKQKKSTTKKNQKESTTKATTKATQANVCYVTVDGYCSGKSVSLQGGDTAYSVLKQCGANVSAEKSQHGIYVKGINGRFEFDEGPASGWKYSVNGSNPSKAADKCSVGKGDIVKWYYVK